MVFPAQLAQTKFSTVSSSRKQPAPRAVRGSLRAAQPAVVEGHGAVCPVDSPHARSAGSSHVPSARQTEGGAPPNTPTLPATGRASGTRGGKFKTLCRSEEVPGHNQARARRPVGRPQKPALQRGMEMDETGPNQPKGGWATQGPSRTSDTWTSR